MRIEISCDLGEARTDAERAVEARLWTLVDAANVACGGHVGDPESMREAVRAAARHGVILGAHPSFPDREGFGRRPMEIDPDALARSLREQIGALREIGEEEGVELRRVKPHGALYNLAHADQDLASVVAEAVEQSGRLALVASPGSALLAAGERLGLEVIAEAFGDRRYRRDGSLVPRSEKGALLLDLDEAASQAEGLATRGGVVTAEGVEIPIRFATLCVHGDMPDAVARVEAIRARLEEQGRGTRDEGLGTRD
jgi:5-oxoprolinase (ATP-hydrolysing) subunit A